MRLIVGCEFSQVVMSAFLEKGHDAYSCDLKPCEGKYPKRHYQCDILELLKIKKFDLGIFHPPCNYLSYAGARWFKNNPERYIKREKALAFFLELYNAPIEKICVENPHGYPRVAFRQPDQEIHPYYFGDPYMKRTLLWLKNLPLLIYEITDTLFDKRTATEKPKPDFIRKDGNKQYFCSRVRNPKDRSRFWPSIAQAMADQWG